VTDHPGAAVPHPGKAAGHRLGMNARRREGIGHFLGIPAHVGMALRRLHQPVIPPPAPGLIRQERPGFSDKTILA